MCDVFEEASFSQKYLQKAKYRFSTTWVKKIVDRLKSHWLSDTEKVTGSTISRDDYVNSLLGHEMNHNYWIPWKSNETVNSVSYWQLFSYIYIHIYMGAVKIMPLTWSSTIRRASILFF